MDHEVVMTGVAVTSASGQCEEAFEAALDTLHKPGTGSSRGGRPAPN